MHDLRNHLAIIVGFSELLMVEAGAGELRLRDVREIHAAAQSALGLLNRLNGAP